MNERDELADKIEVAAPISAGDAESIADAILEAGYRKPRTITTAEELDALPWDSVVRTESGVVLEKWVGEDDAEWRVSGHRPWTTAELAVNLPATVLWEPK